MQTRTKGKPNAHVRALFPPPRPVREALANLSEEDRKVVNNYLGAIKLAASGAFVGRVPLFLERAPLLDCLAKILTETPGLPRNTAARRAVEQCGLPEGVELSSLVRWLVNERKRQEARG